MDNNHPGIQYSHMCLGKNNSLNLSPSIHPSILFCLSISGLGVWPIPASQKCCCRIFNVHFLHFYAFMIISDLEWYAHICSVDICKSIWRQRSIKINGCTQMHRNPDVYRWTPTKLFPVCQHMHKLHAQRLRSTKALTRA